MDDYHPNFENWFQEVKRIFELPITLADAHTHYTGWIDTFSHYIVYREQDLLRRVTIRSMKPGLRFIWGDFEALSYSRGEDNVGGRVRLNGVESCISRNLEAALRAVRDLPEM